MGKPITIIGIDPGASGGVAWTWNDSGTAPARCQNMPDTPHELADLIRNITTGNQESFVYVEKVHSMPGNGVASMFKFGKGVGVIFGVLAALGIPYVEVSPQKWMKIMELPRDKAERKRTIKAGMQARYPDLKVTLKTADALGILTYALETRNNG